MGDMVIENAHSSVKRENGIVTEVHAIDPQGSRLAARLIRTSNSHDPEHVELRISNSDESVVLDTDAFEAFVDKLAEARFVHRDAQTADERLVKAFADWQAAFLSRGLYPRDTPRDILHDPDQVSRMVRFLGFHSGWLIGEIDRLRAGKPSSVKDDPEAIFAELGEVLAMLAPIRAQIVELVQSDERIHALFDRVATLEVDRNMLADACTASGSGQLHRWGTDLLERVDEPRPKHPSDPNGSYMRDICALIGVKPDDESLMEEILAALKEGQRVQKRLDEVARALG